MSAIKYILVEYFNLIIKVKDLSSRKLYEIYVFVTEKNSQSPVPVEAPSSTRIGVVAISILIVIFTGIAVLDLCKVGKKTSKKHAKTHKRRRRARKLKNRISDTSV